MPHAQSGQLKVNECNKRCCTTSCREFQFTSFQSIWTWQVHIEYVTFCAKSVQPHALRHLVNKLQLLCVEFKPFAYLSPFQVHFLHWIQIDLAAGLFGLWIIECSNWNGGKAFTPSIRILYLSFKEREPNLGEYKRHTYSVWYSQFSIYRSAEQFPSVDFSSQTKNNQYEGVNCFR